jgi:hypothetical protein
LKYHFGARAISPLALSPHCRELTSGLCLVHFFITCRRSGAAYYTERQWHIDLTNVAFRGGELHVFQPDAATTAALAELRSANLATEPGKARGPASKGSSRIGGKSGGGVGGGVGGGGVGGVGGVGGPAEEQRLPCYESVDKGSAGDRVGLCPLIRVHGEPLDDAECGRRVDRTLFFLAPHFPGNFFHLM